MFSAEEFATITRLAKENNIDAAALCAVIAIESGGKMSTNINGAAKPLIRFEGHYFDRRLNGHQKTTARNQNLAHPKAGRIKNPRGQGARYQLLAKAQKINHQAAIESTSWGLGQVMGAHWNWLGYASADALMQEALSGFEGQLRLMLRFIVKSNLRPKVRARDWKGFARTYNGPNYKKNRYDTKLARAYARFKKGGHSTQTKPIKNGAMAYGATGEDVRTLQMVLTSKGYYCFQDGIFGQNTRAALKEFQSQHKLNASGVVDQETRKALGLTPRSGFFSRLFKTMGEKLTFGISNSQTK